MENFIFLKTIIIELNYANNIIISDGKSIWNEDIKRKKVVVSNVDEDPLAFHYPNIFMIIRINVKFQKKK